MKISEELSYEDIAKDDWLFNPLYICPVEEIIYLTNYKNFAHKDSYYAEKAGKNKRFLTVKEQFLIKLLRNNKCLL